MLPCCRYLLLTCAAALAMAGNGVAQETSQPPLTLQTYTRADGLPSNYVFSIYQDREGFLWFCTDSGLARYDGAGFRTWTTNDGLPHNFVYRLYQDAHGRYWAQTFDGIAFSGKDGSFMPLPGMNRTHGGDGITGDAFGRIYVTTEQGLWLTEGFETRLLYAHPTAKTRPVALADGRIAVALHDSLLLITPRADTVEQRLFPLDAPVPDLFQTLLFPRPDGKLWVVFRDQAGQTYHAVLTLTPDGPVLQPQPPIGLPLQILEDPHGTTYAVTRQKLYRIPPDGTRQRYGIAHGLAYPQLQDILIDYEGSLWIATHGGGAQKLIGTHLRDWGRTDPALQHSMRRLYLDRARHLWAISTDALLRMTPSGRVTRVAPARLGAFGDVVQISDGRFYAGLTAQLYGPVAAEAIGTSSEAFVVSNWTSRLQNGPGDTLWVGTYGGGALRFYDGYLTRRLMQADGLASDIVEDVQPTLSAWWFLTHGEGATRLRNGQLRIFTTADGLPSDAVFSVYEQADGTTWLGTDRGIARLENDGATALGAAALAGRRVMGFFEYALPSAKARPTLYAVAGALLYRVGADQVTALGSFPLVPDPTAAINEVLYDAPGERLLLATTQGLVEVDLRQLSAEATPPRVALTGLRANDIPVPLHEPIRLPFYRNNLTLQFAPLTFTNETAARTQYRLNDQPWSAPTAAREITLLNLREGDYTFAVRAHNADGLRSDEVATLRFTIVPPFWRTGWFLGLMTLLGLGLLVLVVRQVSTRKLRAQVRQLETERRVQAERERISRDLHDHLGAQISNIIAGVEIAGQYAKRDDTEQVQTYLDALDEDARETMLQLRETIWALHQQAVALPDFLREAERYAQRLLRYHEALRFEATLGGDETLTLRPVQALGLFRIVQEALNNTLKHARARHLTLTLTGRSTEAGTAAIVLCLRDDGRGGAPTLDGTAASSYGLRNMQARATELGGHLRLTSPPQEGTTLEITVPVETPSA